MKQVPLPDGTPTSQIGFGCAALFAGPGLETARRLVGAALDAGIRHFDTAPAYGSGTSEDALAAALEGRDHGVTITTKLGLARPAAAAPASAGLKLRQFARKALAFAPGLKAKLGQRAYQMSRRTDFSIDALEASLADSLKRLRRERVDVLLLHEPEPHDVTDELARWMEDKVAQGRAGTVGFGAKRTNLAAVLANWPNTPFVQTDWSPEGLPQGASGTMHFRSYHGALRSRAEVGARIDADAALRQRLVAHGIDLAAPNASAEAALALALGDNPEGLLLITSSSPERIAHAAKAAALR
ncbi:aldo/keto reductase [Novosphingobium sp.]|uniref:aldo/keto reductase n=1 Tax=Novosphingobium sp. TaxID=1874826 RepID=UPI0026154FD5|nr:aldo/keto reductase [Novosphingobium sp.]